MQPYLKRSLSLLALSSLSMSACGGETPAGTPPADASSGGAPQGGGAPAGGMTGDAAGGAAAPIESQVVRFEVADDPAATPLATMPFPSDLYRDASGRLDLRGFPNPRNVTLLGTVLQTIHDQTPGFGTTSTFYVSFEGPLDERALPVDGAASLRDESALWLVDIDADSPRRGERFPVRWKTREAASGYLPAHTLMLRTVEGIVLRPSTTYALMVLSPLGEPSTAFSATLAASEPEGAGLKAAWRNHAPLRAYLDGASAPTGLRDRLASAAVFTTQDPVSELFKARDAVFALPDPEVVSIESRGVQQNRVELFDGVYRAPRFQKGDIPYRLPGEGAMVFDAEGNPVIQGYEDIRFSLAVPKQDSPVNGWPVVMYGHGTGGDYHSFISEKLASLFTRNGVAVLSIDQIHHGTRDNGACDATNDPSVCAQLLFFNFIQPSAGRDNVRQSALDYVTLLKLARSLEIRPNQSMAGLTVTLDTQNVTYMGHSQGGLNGALFLAIEPTVKGAMLSGAGGGLDLAVERKKLPVDISAPFAGLLGLGSDDVLDRWHPTLMLIETYIGPGEPLNYARYWFDEPWPGHAPKSAFLTIGLDDLYTPAELNFALCTAARVPVVDPVIAPIEGNDILGLTPTFPPYRGNVAEGRASAGLAQYEGQGHFVIFDIPSAQQRAVNFVLSMAEDEVPQIF
jgi:pimeloyl-ACP methyl ester carboxylesterase